MEAHTAPHASAIAALNGLLKTPSDHRKVTTTGGREAGAGARTGGEKGNAAGVRGQGEEGECLADFLNPGSKKFDQCGE